MARTVLMTAVLVTAVGCKSNKHEAPAAAPPLAGLAAVPASVDQIIGADVAALARAPLVVRGVEELLASDAELAADLAALSRSCKLDPVRDLRHLWIGMDRDGGDQVVMVVEGSFKEGDLVACVGHEVGAAGGHLSSQEAEGRTHYHVDQGEGRPDVWFALAGPDTLAVASSADFLTTALGTGGKAATDAGLGRLMGRAGTDHALWFAGKVPAAVGAGLVKASDGALVAPVAMYGHLDLAGPLDAALGVEMPAEKDAIAAVSLIKPQLQTLALVAQARGLGQAVARIEVEADGATVRAHLALSEDEVKTLVSTPIDTVRPDEQYAAPSEAQGAPSDGQGDATSGSQAPVRQQREVDR